MRRYSEVEMVGSYEEIRLDNISGFERRPLETGERNCYSLNSRV